MSNAYDSTKGKLMNSSHLSDTIVQSGKSKLNPDQIEERIRFHAERIALGQPSIKGICRHWLDKYGISMHESSEREWYENNRESVEKKINTMTEKGELSPLTSSIPSLSVSVEKMARDSSDVLNLAKKNLKIVSLELNKLLNGKVPEGMEEISNEDLDKKIATAQKLLSIYETQHQIQNKTIDLALKIQARLDTNAFDLKSAAAKKRHKKKKEEEFDEAEIIDIDELRKKHGIE